MRRKKKKRERGIGGLKGVSGETRRTRGKVGGCERREEKLLREGIEERMVRKKRK